jgi:type III secretion protein V
MVGSGPGGRAWWGAGALLRALPQLGPTTLVIALLACVLVPLPTVLVDLLLSLSLAGAVLVLVAAMLVRRSTDFLGFPTLLLLLTLFRLALNITTTRLILSQADAGRVVDAFASVVVRGDLVVGAVMFAIITAVQYIVIARGAERVAEVGARFALDGLPGHQAAIDADLRSRVISPREAAQRRARLSERSNFHGAMDGAMRFVKGDAIIGLVITGINVAGGVAIARWRQDLPLLDGLDLYGRLTIGDGLLSQIPALLVSLAAGIMVARVDRQSDAVTAVRWIEPPMLIVPAALLAVLAAVPGMPGLAFLATATVLATVALLWTSRSEANAPIVPPGDDPRVVVRVGAAAVDPRGLERVLSEVASRCSATARVEIPAPEVALDSSLGERTIAVELGDRRLAREALPAGDLEEHAVVAVFRALMDHAELFVSHAWLERELDAVRVRQPALVERALSRIDPVDLHDLVRRVVHDRAPCPRIVDILEVVATCDASVVADRVRMSELVREALAPVWLPPVLDALERLGPVRMVRLGADAEAELERRRVVGAMGVRLGLSARQRDAWVAAVVDAASTTVTTGPLVVLVAPSARAAVAELVRRITPHVTVLSFAELDAAGVRRPDALRLELDIDALASI